MLNFCDPYEENSDNTLCLNYSSGYIVLITSSQKQHGSLFFSRIMCDCSVLRNRKYDVT